MSSYRSKQSWREYLVDDEYANEQLFDDQQQQDDQVSLGGLSRGSRASGISSRSSRKSSLLRAPRAHVAHPYAVDQSPLLQERMDEIMHSGASSASVASSHSSLPAVASSAIDAEDVDELAYEQDIDDTDRLLDNHEADYIGIQTLMLEDGLQCDMQAYRFVRWKFVVFYLLPSLLTGGIWFLLCRWLPYFQMLSQCLKCHPLRADYMLIKSSWTGGYDIVTVSRWHSEHAQNIYRQLVKHQSYQPHHHHRHHHRHPHRHSRRAADDNVLVQFNYRCMTFIYNALTGLFVENTTWRVGLNAQTNGLTESEVHERHLLFGPNNIDIPVKSYQQLLVDEVLNPFYLFQMFSIMLWLFEAYWYYAACIFVISTLSSIVTLRETRRNIMRLREMAALEEVLLQVRRDGAWVIVSANELLPGDVYQLDTHVVTIPCDSVILSGDCIINESMLTGESVPVFKSPLPEGEIISMDESVSIDPKHYLFNGTKVVRVRNLGSDNALALVIRTGFNTAKGSLIRSIMHPKPNSFKFYQDAYKFLGVLSLIAMVGFVYSIVMFVQRGVSWQLMVVRALDLITIVIPPALPAAMSVGTAFAISRLKLRNIYCISPPRVNVCGKLNMIVFDKTGTLTEDGLDVLGVCCNDGKIFAVLHSAVLKSTLGQWQRLVEATACCQSIKIVDGQAIGDPLDLKMVDFTGWQLKDDHEHVTVISADGAKFVTIKHCFEFASALRRMSVLVQEAEGGFKAYCKGAPETIQSICRPESVPESFQQVVDEHAKNGLRVIAFAGLQLNTSEVRGIERDSVERDMDFLGLMVFENKLKPQTTAVIQQLHKSNIREVMCTGDNLLTATSVARQCSLITQHCVIYTPRFEWDYMSNSEIVVWRCVIDDELVLDSITLKPINAPNASKFSLNRLIHSTDTSMRSSMSLHPESPHDVKMSPRSPLLDVELGLSMDEHNRYSLAMTGEMFSYLVASSSKAFVHKLLLKTAVFARMSPDQKLELVERLSDIGFCVAMVGDGANDCGALKAAAVGISLSETEASVAAPLTATSGNIECVLDVIKEGRAALVTSFTCFKFIALYSMIQFTSACLLYTLMSNLGDFQYLYIDLFIILPIALFMGKTGASDTVCKRRPTASLVSPRVLLSLIGQICIQLAFQIVVFAVVQRQSWYQPPQSSPEEKNILGYENTTLFLISSYQYIIVALIFNRGPPYRQRLYMNRPFIAALVLLFLVSTYMTLLASQWVNDLMELMPQPTTFQLFIVALAAVNYVASLVAEEALFPVVSARMRRIFKSMDD